MVAAHLAQWILGLQRVAPYAADTVLPVPVSIASEHLGSGRLVSPWSAVTSSGNCCDALHKTLEDQVAFPNATAYSSSIGSYWSLKNVDVHPSCVVLPESAEDVSAAISTLSLGANVWQEKCQFAVRGGGHTPYASAATIEQGIVIDLKSMPSPGLAADHKTITVSPSQTWDQVYSALDPFDLATLGGRVGGVGVGGLTTGCGISYFSPRYGFTCDIVENFEAVLATGDIVNANAHENMDLWKALRGGSNNFAVVTSITLKTFPQGKFWGGQTFHSIGTRKAQFQALEDLIASDPYDPYAHFINTVVITNMTYGSWIIGNSLQYTKSDPPEPFPKVFEPFTDFQRVPIFPGGPDNTLRIDNHTDFAMEYASLSTYKKRWLFATISFGNSAQMMEEFWKIADRHVQPFIYLPGFQLSISYQPLPTIMSERNGAIDSLGPIQTEGNMFYIHWAMAVDGSEASSDGPLQSTVKDIFAAATKKAEELGVKRDYLALTYADGWQDPIGSRSAGTIEEMLAASRKYDPLQLFQKQVPGGFKLPKAKL